MKLIHDRWNRGGVSTVTSDVVLEYSPPIVRYWDVTGSRNLLLTLLPNLHRFIPEDRWKSFHYHTY